MNPVRSAQVSQRDRVSCFGSFQTVSTHHRSTIILQVTITAAKGMGGDSAVRALIGAHDCPHQIWHMCTGGKR